MDALKEFANRPATRFKQRHTHVPPPDLDQCCCGCSLRDGVLIITVLSIISFLWSVVVLGLFGFWVYYLLLITHLANFVFALMGFFGAYHYKPYLIKLYTIWLLIDACLLLLWTIVGAAAGSAYCSEFLTGTAESSCIATVVGNSVAQMLISVPLTLYFAWVSNSFLNQLLSGQVGPATGGGGDVTVVVISGAQQQQPQPQQDGMGWHETMQPQTPQHQPQPVQHQPQPSQHQPVYQQPTQAQHGIQPMQPQPQEQAVVHPTPPEPPQRRGPPMGRGGGQPPPGPHAGGRGRGQPPSGPHANSRGRGQPPSGPHAGGRGRGRGSRPAPVVPNPIRTVDLGDPGGSIPMGGDEDEYNDSPIPASRRGPPPRGPSPPPRGASPPPRGPSPPPRQM